MSALRAFFVTASGKMFFQQASNLYRYWFNRASRSAPGRVSLQMSNAALTKFRNSVEGKKVEAFVDIFYQGGGWYEITESELPLSREFPNATIYHLGHNGVARWIQVLNTSHVVVANANYYKFAVQYVPKIVAAKQPSFENKLNALAQKFAHS